MAVHATFEALMHISDFPFHRAFCFWQQRLLAFWSARCDIFLTMSLPRLLNRKIAKPDPPDDRCTAFAFAFSYAYAFAFAFPYDRTALPLTDWKVPSRRCFHESVRILPDQTCQEMSGTALLVSCDCHAWTFSSVPAGCSMDTRR